MSIHKEGRLLLLVLLLVFSAGAFATFKFIPEPWSWLIYTTLSVLFILVLQFFRHPSITITRGDNLVISPADGKVVVIEKTHEDEYLKEDRIQISIFMSPLNVHVNRSPVAGIISFYKYHAGKYLVAWHPKSSTENERTTVVVKQNNMEILFRQIAGAVARRIKCYVDEGQQIGKGEEFGFIKFGSRVDVFLPLDADIKVQPGQKTKGGRTVLAELK